MAAFEKKEHISRNLLFTAVALLSVSVMENRDRVLADWIFHDRTDDVRKNALGCLFRYVTVGLSIGKDMTLREFLKALSDRSNEGLAHCSYEWSVLQNNVYEHDTMIVCYETAEIMSTSSIGSIGGTRLNVESHAPVNSRSLAFQIIENTDGIIPYLMFNHGIYSEEKISRAVEVFSGVLDRLMNAEEPDRVRLAEII